MSQNTARDDCSGQLFVAKEPASKFTWYIIRGTGRFCFWLSRGKSWSKWRKQTGNQCMWGWGSEGAGNWTKMFCITSNQERRCWFLARPSFFGVLLLLRSEITASASLHIASARPITGTGHEAGDSRRRNFDSRRQVHIRRRIGHQWKTQFGSQWWGKEQRRR